jgi:hypothetical protein
MSLSAAQLASPGKRAALFDDLLRDTGVVGAEAKLAVRQALESAFMAGAALVQADPGFDPLGRGSKGEPDFVDIDELPQQAHDGFLLMTQVVGLERPGEHPDKAPEPLVLRAFHSADGKRSWWAELPRRATEARWSQWAILECERYGLIAELPNNPGRSTLTHRAIVMMQTGRASLDVPATPAWERNPRARDVAVNGRRQPALI